MSVEAVTPAGATPAGATPAETTAKATPSARSCGVERAQTHLERGRAMPLALPALEPLAHAIEAARRWMAEADALLGAAAENVADEPAKATNAPSDSGGVDAVAGVPPTSLAAGTADAATNADATDAAAAAAAAPT